MSEGRADSSWYEELCKTEKKLEAANEEIERLKEQWQALAEAHEKLRRDNQQVLGELAAWRMRGEEGER